ncbi:extracellular solute-binding protein [Cryptosporangium sp. NPDC051539]|uniref:extracellular solute-binding protein n=1 Tax=Cryptosporangium sp. NPDC051539 TaxID=3363962 RepID=UPI0037907E5B
MGTEQSEGRGRPHQPMFSDDIDEPDRPAAPPDRPAAAADASAVPGDGSARRPGAAGRERPPRGDDRPAPGDDRPAPGDGDDRPSGALAWWQAGRDFRRDHPGWSGFLAGLLVGVLVVVGVGYLRPHLTDTSWEDGELVLLSGSDDSAGGQRQELIAEWNRLHPEHPARIEEVPNIADAERSEMLARADGDGGPIDVLNLDVAFLPEFAEAGLLREFPDDDVDRDAFLSGPLGTCEYKGKLWALPFNTDAALLYRRTALVPKAPSSWTSMLASIARVLEGNPRAGTVPEAGFVTQLGDYEGLTVNAIEAVWSAGGDIVDDDGHVHVDSRQAQEGLRQLVDGVHSDPKQILPTSLEYTEDASTSAFRADRALFMRNWPVAYRRLENPTEPGTTRIDFEVSPLPWPSVLGGQNLAIAEHSSHPRAAEALINFLTDSRSQQILFERGGFAATRRVVYEDAKIKQVYPYADELLKALEAARPRPKSPHYALFSEVLREAVHTMLVTGAGPPPDLGDRLRAALRGERR